MKTRGLTLLFTISLILGTMVLMGALSAASALPERHPVEVDSGLCSQCHDDKPYAIDHVPGWYAEHRFRAAQDERLCSLCHSQSFCADCHAGKEELKPSEKYSENPLRQSPHMGDYLTRHKIDAKIDPSSCFRCHGRGNNTRCMLCHK